MLVLFEMVGSASSLFLVTWSAKAVGIDVKRYTASKDTIISCGVMLQTETFSTKSQLFVTTKFLFLVVMPDYNYNIFEYTLYLLVFQPFTTTHCWTN